jgi:hypothetical protein
MLARSAERKKKILSEFDGWRKKIAKKQVPISIQDLLLPQKDYNGFSTDLPSSFLTTQSRLIKNRLELINLVGREAQKTPYFIDSLK